MPEYSVNLTFEGDSAIATQWAGYAKQKAREFGAQCAGSKLPYGSRWYYVDNDTKIHVRYIDGIQKAHIIAAGVLHGIAFWPRTTSFPLGWGMPYVPAGEPGENVPMGTYGGQWPDIIATRDSLYPSEGHDYVAKITRGPTYGPKFKLQPAEHLEYGNLVWYVGSDIYSTRKFNESWYHAPVNFTSSTFFVAGRAYTGPGVVLGFARFNGVKIGIFMNNSTKLETAYILDDLNDSGTWTVIGSWTNPYSAFFDNSNSRPRYYKFSSDGSRAARLCAHSTTNHTALVWIVFDYNTATQEYSVTDTYEDLGLNGATISKSGSASVPDEPSETNYSSFSGLATSNYFIGYRPTASYSYSSGWNWVGGSFQVEGAYYTATSTAGIYAPAHTAWVSGMEANLPQGPYIEPFSDLGYTIDLGSCGNGYEAASLGYEVMFDQEPPTEDTPFQFGAAVKTIPVANITYSVTWEFSSSETYDIVGEAYIGVDFIQVTEGITTVEKVALAVLKPRVSEFEGYRSFTRTAESTQHTGTLFSLGLTTQTTDYQETLQVECSYADPHDIIIRTAGISAETAVATVGALADRFTISVGSEWLVGNSDARELTTYVGNHTVTLVGENTLQMNTTMNKTLTWSGVASGSAVDRSASTKKFLDMDIAAGVFVVLEVTDVEQWPASNSATPYDQDDTAAYAQSELFVCSVAPPATELKTVPTSDMLVSTDLVNPATGGSTTTNVYNEQIRVYAINYLTGAAGTGIITPAGVAESTTPGAVVAERSPIVTVTTGNYGFFSMFSGSQMVRYKQLYCLIMADPFYGGRPYDAAYTGLTEFFTVDTTPTITMSDAYTTVGVDTVTAEKMQLTLSGNRFGVV